MKSQKRKVLASVESRMGGKKKKCNVVYTFAAETKGIQCYVLTSSKQSQTVLH